MNKRPNMSKWLVPVVVLWMAVVTAEAQKPPYVILPNGKPIEGTAIRAKMDGTVIIETSNGSRTFAKGQYLKALAAKPKAFTDAQSKASSGDFAGAIPLLEDVAKKLKNLGWDVKALQMLPQVYLKKGDGEKAVQAYDKLFRSNPETESDGETMVGYFEALLAAKKYDKLDSRLDQMVAKGSRADAAKAQLIRGDARMAQNQAEAAVLDYLKTAILYKKQKEYQAEALYKAAEALGSLKDPRAKEFYQRVVSEHGSSPYAQQAKTKI